MPRQVGLPARDRVFSAMVLFVAVAALGALVTREPIDHGYIRYAAVADEVVRSGDWTVLRLTGKVYVHKPPVFVWIIALAMELGGTDAGWTHHAPNLVALGLTVAFMLRLGRRIFGRVDAACLAALFLVTSVELATLLRDKRIDPLFAAFLLGAMDAFHRAWTAPAEDAGRGVRRREGLAAGFWLALATLTKGPLALAFFAAPAATLAVWERRVRAAALRDAIPGALLFLVLVSIWPALVVRELGLAPTLRALHDTDLVTRGGGLLHYVWNLPVQLLPWTVFVPALAIQARRGAVREDGAARRFLVAWAASLFLILHLSSARHSRYLLPLFPPLALALATLWFEAGSGREARLDEDAARWRDGATRLGLALFALAGAGAVAAAPFVHEGGLALAGIGALCAFGGVDGLRSALAGGPPRVAALRVALLGVLALAGWDATQAARLSAQDQVPAARAALAAIGDAPVLAVALDEGPDALVDQLLQRTVPRARTPEEAKAWLEAQGASAPRWLVAAVEPGGAVAVEAGFLARTTPFRMRRTDLVLIEVLPAPPGTEDDSPAR